MRGWLEQNLEDPEFRRRYEAELREENALAASEDCATEAYRRRGQFHAWMKLSDMWADVHAGVLARSVAVYYERHLRARIRDRLPAIACELVVAGGTAAYLLAPGLATGAAMTVAVLSTVVLANRMPPGRELLPPTLYVPPWAGFATGCWWLCLVAWALLGGPAWLTALLLAPRAAWMIWVVGRACAEEHEARRRIR